MTRTCKNKCYQKYSVLLALSLPVEKLDPILQQYSSRDAAAYADKSSLFSSLSLTDNAVGNDRRIVTYAAKLTGLGGWCSGEQSSTGDKSPSEFSLSLGVWQ